MSHLVLRFLSGLKSLLNKALYVQRTSHHQTPNNEIQTIAKISDHNAPRIPPSKNDKASKHNAKIVKTHQVRILIMIFDYCLGVETNRLEKVFETCVDTTECYET